MCILCELMETAVLGWFLGTEIYPTRVCNMNANPATASFASPKKAALHRSESPVAALKTWNSRKNVKTTPCSSLMVIDVD